MVVQLLSFHFILTQMINREHRVNVLSMYSLGERLRNSTLKARGDIVWAVKVGRVRSEGSF